MKKQIKTESLKISSYDDKDEKEMEKYRDGAIKIKYKDLELEMLGFNKIFSPQDMKRLIYAFKIKPETRNVMFYFPKTNLKIENKVLKMTIVKEMEEMAKKNGFEMQDVIDVLKNIYSQRHVMGKVGGGK